jgi:hypothetical protein
MRTTARSALGRETTMKKYRKAKRKHTASGSVSNGTSVTFGETVASDGGATNSWSVSYGHLRATTMSTTAGGAKRRGVK